MKSEAKNLKKEHVKWYTHKIILPFGIVSDYFSIWHWFGQWAGWADTVYKSARFWPTDMELHFISNSSRNLMVCLAIQAENPSFSHVVGYCWTTWANVCMHLELRLVWYMAAMVSMPDTASDKWRLSFYAIKQWKKKFFFFFTPASVKTPRAKSE